MQEPVTIHVSFSQYDGGYVATSADCRGLFVSNQSFTKVLESVPRAIKLLFKAEHGVEVDVKEVSKPEVVLVPIPGGLEVAYIAHISSGLDGGSMGNRERVLCSAP